MYYLINLSATEQKSSPEVIVDNMVQCWRLRPPIYAALLTQAYPIFILYAVYIILIFRDKLIIINRYSNLVHFIIGASSFSFERLYIIIVRALCRLTASLYEQADKGRLTIIWIELKFIFMSYSVQATGQEWGLYDRQCIFTYCTYIMYNTYMYIYIHTHVMYKFIISIYTYPTKHCTNENIRQPTKAR